MISWQQPTIKPWVRIVAFFTAFAFTFTSVVWDGGQRSYAATAQTEQFLPSSNLAVQAPAFRIDRPDLPDSYGTIKSTFKGSKDQMVLHIQDAHVNEEAQHNIANIIRYFSEKYQLRLVNLEGASGELYTDLFSFFPNKKARQDVAGYFLKEGRLTGPEYLTIVEKPVITLYGVEDPELYEENRKAYVEALDFKGRDEKILAELNKLLEGVSRFIFSEEIRELNRRRGAFQEGGPELVAYVRYLVELGRKRHIALDDYPGMHSLLELVDLEKKVDFEKAEKETDLLINDLKHILSREKLSRFLTNTVHFRMKKMKRAAYYGYLEEEIKGATPLEAGAGANAIQNKYANVLSYIKYMKIYDAIDVSIFNEIEFLEKTVKNKLFTSPEQVKLDHLIRIHDIYSKMFDFTLTKQDAEFYYTFQDEFKAETFTSFLKPLLKQYHFSYGLPSQLETLDQDLPRVERFYKAALQRDQVLIERAVEKTQNSNQTISAIVTGGFHTPGIEKYLREKDISYIVVAPRITKKIDQSKESFLYDAALRETPLPIEKTLSEVFLAPKTGVLNDPRFQLAALRPVPSLPQIQRGENLNLARAYDWLVATLSYYADPNARSEIRGAVAKLDVTAQKMLSGVLPSLAIMDGNKLWMPNQNATLAAVAVLAGSDTPRGEIKVPGARQRAEIRLNEKTSLFVYPHIDGLMIPDKIASAVRAELRLLPQGTVSDLSRGVLAEVGVLQPVETIAPEDILQKELQARLQTVNRQKLTKVYGEQVLQYENKPVSYRDFIEKLLASADLVEKIDMLQEKFPWASQNIAYLRFALWSSDDPNHATPFKTLQEKVVALGEMEAEVHQAKMPEEKRTEFLRVLTSSEFREHMLLQYSADRIRDQMRKILKAGIALNTYTMRLSEYEISIRVEQDRLTREAAERAVKPVVPKAAPEKPTMNMVIEKIRAKYQGKPLPDMRSLPELPADATQEMIIARIKAEFGYDDQDIALLAKAPGISLQSGVLGTEQWWAIYKALEGGSESYQNFSAAQLAQEARKLPEGLSFWGRVKYRGVAFLKRLVTGRLALDLVKMGPHILDNFFYNFYRKKIGFYWFRSGAGFLKPKAPLPRELSIDVLAGAMLSVSKPNFGRDFLDWQKGTLIERGIYHVFLKHENVVTMLNGLQFGTAPGDVLFRRLDKALIQPFVVPTLQFLQKRWKLAFFGAIGLAIVTFFLPASLVGVSLLGSFGVWAIHATAGVPVIGITVGALVHSFALAAFLKTAVLSFQLVVPSFSQKYSNAKIDQVILRQLQGLREIKNLDFLTIRQIVRQIVGAELAIDQKLVLLQELQAILPEVRYQNSVERTLLTHLIHEELKNLTEQSAAQARAPPTIQLKTPGFFKRQILYPFMGVLKALISNPFAEKGFYGAWAVSTWGMAIVGGEIAAFAGGEGSAVNPAEYGAVQWAVSQFTDNQHIIQGLSLPVTFVEHQAIGWGQNLLQFAEHVTHIPVSDTVLKGEARLLGAFGFHTEAGDFALSGWNINEISMFQYARLQAEDAANQGLNAGLAQETIQGLKDGKFLTAAERAREFERIQLSLELAAVEKNISKLPLVYQSTAEVLEAAKAIRTALSEIEFPLRGKEARVELADLAQQVKMLLPKETTVAQKAAEQPSPGFFARIVWALKSTVVTGTTGAMFATVTPSMDFSKFIQAFRKGPPVSNRSAGVPDLPNLAFELESARRATAKAPMLAQVSAPVVPDREPVTLPTTVVTGTLPPEAEIPEVVAPVPAIIPEKSEELIKTKELLPAVSSADQIPSFDQLKESAILYVLKDVSKEDQEKFRKQVEEALTQAAYEISAESLPGEDAATAFKARIEGLKLRIDALAQASQTVSSAPDEEEAKPVIEASTGPALPMELFVVSRDFVKTGSKAGEWMKSKKDVRRFDSQHIPDGAEFFFYQGRGFLKAGTKILVKVSDARATHVRIGKDIFKIDQRKVPPPTEPVEPKFSELPPDRPLMLGQEAMIRQALREKMGETQPPAAKPADMTPSREISDKTKPADGTVATVIDDKVTASKRLVENIRKNNPNVRMTEILAEKHKISIREPSFLKAYFEVWYAFRRSYQKIEDPGYSVPETFSLDGGSPLVTVPLETTSPVVEALPIPDMQIEGYRLKLVFNESGLEYSVILPIYEGGIEPDVNYYYAEQAIANGQYGVYVLDTDASRLSELNLSSGYTVVSDPRLTQATALVDSFHFGFSDGDTEGLSAFLATHMDSNGTLTLTNAENGNVVFQNSASVWLSAYKQAMDVIIDPRSGAGIRDFYGLPDNVTYTDILIAPPTTRPMTDQEKRLEEVRSLIGAYVSGYYSPDPRVQQNFRQVFSNKSIAQIFESMSRVLPEVQRAYTRQMNVSGNTADAGTLAYFTQLDLAGVDVQEALMGAEFYAGGRVELLLDSDVYTEKHKRTHLTEAAKAQVEATRVEALEEAAGYVADSSLLKKELATVQRQQQILEAMWNAADAKRKTGSISDANLVDLWDAYLKSKERTQSVQVQLQVTENRIRALMGTKGLDYQFEIPPGELTPQAFLQALIDSGIDKKVIYRIEMQLEKALAAEAGRINRVRTATGLRFNYDVTRALDINTIGDKYSLVAVLFQLSGDLDERLQLWKRDRAAWVYSLQSLASTLRQVQIEKEASDQRLQSAADIVERQKEVVAKMQQGVAVYQEQYQSDNILGPFQHMLEVMDSATEEEVNLARFQASFELEQVHNVTLTDAIARAQKVVEENRKRFEKAGIKLEELGTKEPEKMQQTILVHNVADVVRSATLPVDEIMAQARVGELEHGRVKFLGYSVELGLMLLAFGNSLNLTGGDQFYTLGDGATQLINTQTGETKKLTDVRNMLQLSANVRATLIDWGRGSIKFQKMLAGENGKLIAEAGKVGLTWQVAFTLHELARLKVREEIAAKNLAASREAYALNREAFKNRPYIKERETVVNAEAQVALNEREYAQIEGLIEQTKNKLKLILLLPKDQDIEFADDFSMANLEEQFPFLKAYPDIFDSKKEFTEHGRQKMMAVSKALEDIQQQMQKMIKVKDGKPTGPAALLEAQERLKNIQATLDLLMNGKIPSEEQEGQLTMIVLNLLEIDSDLQGPQFYQLGDEFLRLRLILGDLSGAHQHLVMMQYLNHAWNYLSQSRIKQVRQFNVA
ncbi:MAG TPA: hypothetical protein PLO78_06795, partial [Candidatus Omnitrophota bacterium]|nr:hypothetical protein [Candidatus Omnitrophota bacterium]